MFSHISDPLRARLLALPQPVMLDVLLEALDIMQSYNGHNHTYCVCDAMGSRLLDGEWTVPTTADVCAKYNYDPTA